MPNSLGILHGDAKFSKEFCMGCRNPCSVGDTKSTEGVPKSLGNLTRGCRIPYDTGVASSPSPTQFLGSGLPDLGVKWSGRVSSPSLVTLSLCLVSCHPTFAKVGLHLTSLCQCGYMLCAMNCRCKVLINIKGSQQGKMPQQTMSGSAPIMILPVQRKLADLVDVHVPSALSLPSEEQYSKCMYPLCFEFSKCPLTQPFHAFVYNYHVRRSPQMKECSIDRVLQLRPFLAALMCWSSKCLWSYEVATCWTEQRTHVWNMLFRLRPPPPLCLPR